jgi:hypothetical protein
MVRRPAFAPEEDDESPHHYGHFRCPQIRSHHLTIRDNCGRDGLAYQQKQRIEKTKNCRRAKTVMLTEGKLPQKYHF